MVFLLVNCLCRGAIALVESQGQKLYLAAFEDPDHDPGEDTGKFFLIYGLLGIATYLLMPLAKRHIASLSLLVGGLTCISAGFFSLSFQGTVRSLLG